MSPDYRAEAWERDGGRCVRCGKPVHDFWPGFSCHHRQSRSVGPDTLENRITLCGSGTTGCHQYVHANPAESREKGWIISRFLKADELASTECWHHELGWVCFGADGSVNPWPPPAE